MKKSKILMVYLLALVISFFFFINPSLAGELNNLNIDVQLLENGDGIIKSTWSYNDDKGTEHYIVIGNLGDSEIKNFTVSKNGKKYETLGSWDVDKSRQEKTGKAGIVDKIDSYELCWGIGEYGQNNYEVSYKVTNIIKKLRDAQILNFRFVNDQLSEPPQSVSLVIRGYKPFTKEDVKMWGFGFGGEIHLIDGKIVAKSTQPLTKSNYVTTLLRFNPGYFSTNSVLGKSFEDVKTESFKGSSYEDDGNGGGGESNSNVPSGSKRSQGGFLGFLNNTSDIGSLLGFFVPIIAFIGTILFAIVKFFGKLIGGDNKYIKQQVKLLDEQYYREIPYKGNVDDIVYITNRIGKNNGAENFITAMFLKWIKEGRFVQRKQEEGLIFKKETIAFDIADPSNTGMGTNERSLFMIVKKAAGSNQSLESKELSKWIPNHVEEFKGFVEGLESFSERALISNGHMVIEKQGGLLSTPKYGFTNTGKTLVDNNIKFRNYLKDYSLLNEKESPNVHIWDEYMIFAGLYGITEEVQKEFGKLYPQYVEQSSFDTNTIYWATAYSSSVTRSYASATSISSSGGGGGISFGGGGGSFGGGSGGGTR